MEIIPPDRSQRQRSSREQQGFGRQPWDYARYGATGRVFGDRIFLVRPGTLTLIAAALLVGALSVAAFVAIIGTVLFWLPAAAAAVLGFVAWGRVRHWLQRTR